jgi:hypothetical protein
MLGASLYMGLFAVGYGFGISGYYGRLFWRAHLLYLGGGAMAATLVLSYDCFSLLGVCRFW